ncbi:MAG: ParB N-terminal domain-containing protein [Bernardetiaceae bacterium]|jgi:hypothetical protein|nr:ParB N-terminal domain-containing protein [Bernardetiaceae bacterium]
MAKRDKLAGLISEIARQSEVTDDHIRQHIVVWEELKLLIPPLGQAERQQLEDNILAEGCREPIILWANNGGYVLVDGHNRHEICTRLGIPYRINVRPFANLLEVKTWMISNQLGRRNLSPEQQSYLRGARYLLEKASHGGDRKTSAATEPANTSERLAAEYHVSPKTIRRDELYARGLDRLGQQSPNLRQAILGGQAKVNKDQVQWLAEAEEVPPLQTVQELATWLQQRSQATEPPPESEASAAKRALAKADARVRLAVKGSWLIEQGLAQWWAEVCHLPGPVEPGTDYYLEAPVARELGVW